jgi:polysaccharide export outer membrane protein
MSQTAPPAPSPEQLEIFRSLPADQQRAILEEITGAGGSPTAEAPLSTPRVTAPTDLFPRATEPPGPPRIEGGEAILIEVDIEQVSDQELVPLLTNRRDRIRGSNPYRLDAEGRLSLPFLAPIALAGLTTEEAAQRLSSDPRLEGLDFDVTMLPLAPTGSEALRPFGYDIFRESPTTFAPATDIPVPPDYTIGPGDTVIVELFGEQSGRYSLVVDRLGQLNLPEFGPLQVAGRNFDSMREEIERRVTEETIGVRASVSMGPLRSIRVFVLGDVARPGSYTVSGLSTITHALFVSGGVSEVGSLRNVELKRDGNTISALDVYDLLLRGDTSNDERLQSSDVVFVPPVGTIAAIGGRVRRPAIYELKSEMRVEELLLLAGGLMPDADPRAAKVERIDSSRERIVLDLDLSSAAGRALRLTPGDAISVPAVLDDRSRTVTLEGEVMRPGGYAWRQGMRLTDLLGGLEALRLNADQRYLVIRREHMPDRRIEVLSADAVEAFRARGTAADPLLQSRDRIYVFSPNRDRGVALGELLDELRLQARDNASPAVVSIGGRVRAPGQYPLETGMTVGDLIRAGGGLDEAAYALTAELTRYDVVDGEFRTTDVIDVSLSGLLAANGGADVPLQSYDTLTIKETPEWAEQGLVRLVGEVRFPGTYPIRKGETLSSVVRRAGGLTEYAFAEGAVFTRQEIRDQERAQLDNLATRLQSDLALTSLQSQQVASEGANAAETLAIGQSLLAQLRDATPTGRLVIDLEAAVDPGAEEDLELRDRDELLVPPRRQYVTVIGEAQNPTSHIWRRELSRGDYLDFSGGTTEMADVKRIYVVRADGSVVPRTSGQWFRRGESVEMQPGDTIVVPLDTYQVRPLPLWTAVTSIIYNLAVAVAAVNSF